MNLEALSTSYEAELKNDLFNSSHEVNIKSTDLLGPPVCIKEIDMLTCEIHDISQVCCDEITMNITRCGPNGNMMDSFAGWFSVQFDGSRYNPSLVEVELDTGPQENLSTTHWGQEAFFTYPSVAVQNGDRVIANLNMSRKSDNWRLYNLDLQYSVCSASHGVSCPERKVRYHLY